MSQNPQPLDYSTQRPRPPSAATPVQKAIFAVLGGIFVMVIAGVLVSKSLSWRHADPPVEKTLPSGRSSQVVFIAPRFALTDENGKSFSANTLSGRPYICDFIFTTCGSACPMMTHKLADLQKQTPAGVQLVSFTVNPEHDTPPVLKEYAATYGADPSRWHFLTGTTRQMVETVRDMKIGFQAATDHDPILHSEKFLLIDGAGNVRGIYDSLDAQALHDLVVDSAWLAASPGGRGN